MAKQTLSLTATSRSDADRSVSPPVQHVDRSARGDEAAGQRAGRAHGDIIQRRVFWITLAIYCALGVWYSFAVPAFETPDEIYHYAFSRHLAEGHWLPVQSDESTGPWQQEGSQAPLYYMLTGWMTAAVDQSDFSSIAVFNPRANMGNPLYPGNKNRMLYSSTPRPLQGSNLALHGGRWISLVLGGLTLWFTFRTAKLAFADASLLPVVSTLLVAVTPQFLFISASFSNDNMVIAASAAVLYWMARILATSSSRSIRIIEWIVLGMLLGIAALSKLQALGLLILAAGIGLAVARRWRSWTTLLAAAIGTAVPVILIAGWWYWRNQMLYGDWSGVSHLTAINGLRQKPLDLDDFWLEFRGLRYSFWGLFGWFNILLPPWFYTAMDVSSVIGVLGAVSACLVAWHRYGRDVLRPVIAQVRLLLLVWIGLSVALLISWMLRATGSQGRLLFPAIGAISVWLVVGFSFWFRHLRQPWRGIAWAILPGLLLGMSVYSVAIVIPAAYEPPRTVSSIPAEAIRADISYGDDDIIELLAVETSPERAHPGDTVSITLYLTAPEHIGRDYELFVQLLDADSDVLGNVTSHPGWGTNPTSLWRPGAIYADRYLVPVGGWVDPSSPMLARVYVGFINPDSQPEAHHPLVARDSDGAEVTPLVAEIVVSPRTAPSLDGMDLQPTEIVFGDKLELRGASVPDRVQAGAVFTTTLLWSARATPETDYTAFLHLLDSEGNYVAGFDQSPAPGLFPTSYWQLGDNVVGRMAIETVDLTPGIYEVWLGLYESTSQGQTRLPVEQAVDLPVQNDMVRIGTLSVVQP